MPSSLVELLSTAELSASQVDVVNKRLERENFHRERGFRLREREDLAHALEDFVESLCCFSVAVTFCTSASDPISNKYSGLTYLFAHLINISTCTSLNSRLDSYVVGQRKLICDAVISNQHSLDPDSLDMLEQLDNYFQGAGKVAQDVWIKMHGDELNEILSTPIEVEADLLLKKVREAMRKLSNTGCFGVPLADWLTEVGWRSVKVRPGMDLS